MTRFKIEMRVGQDFRIVDADHFTQRDGWLIFLHKPSQGGTKEHWRVQLVDVVSMETCDNA